MTTTRPDRWYDASGPSDKTQIKVRVNPQHRADFKDEARRAQKSVSTWMRDLALREVQRQRAEKELRRMEADLLHNRTQEPTS